jgi:hypothetical protein
VKCPQLTPRQALTGLLTEPAADGSTDCQAPQSTNASCHWPGQACQGAGDVSHPFSAAVGCRVQATLVWQCQAIKSLGSREYADAIYMRGLTAER